MRMSPPKPRPSAPPTPRRVSAALAVACLAMCAAPPDAVAQQDPQRRASATLEGSLALTSLDGGASWMAGATGLLCLGYRLSLGGSGFLALEPRRLAGSAPGSELDLRVAFGGLTAQLDLVETGGREAWARLLVGAGNARLDLAAARTRIASDNFGVLQPEVGGTVRVGRRVRAGAAVGYRVTFGVEDLPGVGGVDLRGPSARLLLALHHP